VLAFVVVLELSTAYVIEPWLFGHSTGVSPIALIVAAVFWAWLWGPIGLLLSTPLTACLVVLGRHVPRLEFLGVLLGAKSVMDPEFTFYQRLLARDQDEAADVVNGYLQTHPPETVCDAVLVPALVLAKYDRDSGALNPDDERFIFQVTRAILDDLVLAPPGEATPKISAEPPSQKVLVLACPACDEADELALQMLRRLLEHDGFQARVLSGQDDHGDAHFADLGESPDVICVGALPPGGLAQARYLCKRLRASFPQQKIVVICWGLPDNAGQRKQELLAAGADAVAITLHEARAQIARMASCVAAVPDARVAVTEPSSAANGRPASEVRVVS
jgi:AI-2E family transporter